MSNFLTKAFGFDATKHTVRTELVAGLTTFLTMAYILAVNPSIFSALPGMPSGSVFTATALAAIIATLVMAFWAKKPFALAPGMGLNAFFVFTVCLTMGHSWQFALTAVLIEGVIFVILTLTKVRTWILQAIPLSLKHAIGAGVGCKQLCDFALALARTDGKYDKEQLCAYLKRAGLLRWQRVLCSLLVADLGLDPACCLPDFTPGDPAPLRRIVLEGGAFGLFDPSREKAVRAGKTVRKMQAAGAFLKRLPFSLRVAPRETVATIGELVKGNLS